MQLCPHCGTENLEGVVFCKNCGIALGPVPLATRRLDEDPERGGTDQLGADGVLILQVGDDAQPIMVQVRNEVILGRVSEQTEDTTYINLTPYGAENLGVSRRHCRLLRDNKAVYVMDLKSTNGTRLNGEPLPAAVEKRVRDGDEIALGRMKLFVYFRH